MHLAAALCLFSQFLTGPPLPPLPPEVVKAQEEVLRYRIEKLPEGVPNGWELIVKAAEQLPKFEKPIHDAASAALKGKPYDVAALGQLAAHADFSRRTIRKSMAMSGWQARPWEPELTSSNSGKSVAFIQMARPLVAHMLLSSTDSEPEALIEDLDLLLRYADRASRSATGLVEGLATCSLATYTDTAIARLLETRRFELQELGELASLLQKLERSPQALKEPFRHELAAQKRLFGGDFSTWEGMAKNMPELPKINPLLHAVWPVFVDPLRLRRMVNDQATDIIANLGKPFTVDGPPGFAAIRAWRKPLSNAEWLTRNSLGESLLMGTLGGYEKIMYGIAMNQSSRGMISVAVALKRWELERGSRLPESLEQLVPHYLPAVPVDYMDGKPLRYHRQQRIVYSVGADLIDEFPPVPDRPSLIIGDGNAVLRFP